MSNDGDPVSARANAGALGWSWALLGIVAACSSGRTPPGAFFPIAEDALNCARRLSSSMSFGDAPLDHPLGATIEAQQVNLMRWEPEGPWQRAITIDWIAVSVHFVRDTARVRAEAFTQRRPRTEWDPAPPDVRALADSIQRHCHSSAPAG